jgi:hypothetical protein
MQKFIFRKRNLVAIGLIILLMIVTYAFAAANVVPETGAGDGEEAISGYTVTNVQYTLDTDPSQISAVGFNIAPTAGASPVREVQVQLEAGGSWFTCDESAAPAVTCAITGVSVLDADQFRVVAVQ